MWWVLYQDLGILVQCSEWEQHRPNLVRLSRRYKHSLSHYKIDDGGQNGSAEFGGLQQTRKGVGLLVVSDVVGTL